MKMGKYFLSDFGHELNHSRQRPKIINYIPSMVTVSNIILGIIALHIILSAGKLNIVAPIILAAVFLDFADGYLARKLDAETRTGCVLDSAADSICFVLVPSLYVLMLHQELPTIFLQLACMFYLLAGVTRLIKYTVSKLRSGEKTGFFSGCPVTGAALCAITAVGINGNVFFHTVLFFMCSYLMVARVKYTPFSKILKRHVKDAFFFIYILLVLPFLVFYPEKVIFAFSLAYLMFFPLNLLWQSICSRCHFAGNVEVNSSRSLRHVLRIFPIARDARGLIIVCILFLLMSVLFLPVGLRIFYAVILLAFAFFFRDPERICDELDEGNVLSPADGRIIGIEKVFNEDRGASLNKVIIFLSILDAHINRAPMDLKILKLEHCDGGNLDARHPNAGENEHNFFTCELTGGNILLLKQIAGKFARRVVSYAKEGDSLNAGERFGMILFGSRVELFLPGNMEILVQKGDVVRAGKTKVAVRK